MISEKEINKLSEELMDYQSSNGSTVISDDEVLEKSIVSAFLGVTLTWLEHKAHILDISPCVPISTRRNIDKWESTKNVYKKIDIFNWLTLLKNNNLIGFEGVCSRDIKKYLSA